MILDDLLQLLPDNYNKSKDSNNYKLSKIMASAFTEIQDTFDRIQLWRDIDNARGTTLDKIGVNVGQPRNGNDDERYRVWLKIKILINNSDGDIESINEIMTALSPDGFLGLQEAWTSPLYDHEPAALIIKLDPPSLPKPALFFDGKGKFDGEYLFSGTKVGDYPANMLKGFDVKKIVSGGVRVYWLIPLTAESYPLSNHFHEVSMTIKHDATSEPLSNLIHEVSTLIKIDDTVSRRQSFDGTMRFDGAITFNGKRDHIASHTGILRVLKDGVVVEETEV